MLTSGIRHNFDPPIPTDYTLIVNFFTDAKRSILLYFKRYLTETSGVVGWATRNLGLWQQLGCAYFVLYLGRVDTNEVGGSLFDQR